MFLSLSMHVQLFRIISRSTWSFRQGTWLTTWIISALLLHNSTSLWGVLDWDQIAIIRHNLRRILLHLLLHGMLRDCWHVLVLWHFCLNSVLLAAQFLLFKCEITTSNVKIIEDLVELIYLSRSQIEGWSWNDISQNHDLFNDLFLRSTHRLIESTKLHFQNFLVQLWMRLVIARQVLNS